MTSIEQIHDAIRSLPLADRLRLVERLVHDAAESSQEETSPTGEAAASLLGLFADEPELIDEVCRMAMEDRVSRSSGDRS